MTLPETCPSCDAPRPGRYCANCGERRVETNELSLGRFFQALGSELVPGIESEEDQALGRAGGRVFRTVYTLFRWPGRLTADYIAGRRRPYLKPIQVYLTISVIFFLFGDNFFRYSLGEYEYVAGYGETADLIGAEVARKGLTLEGYTEQFNERLVGLKKIMFAAVVPFFALALMPMYRRRRIGEHIVYSIHAEGALLLFMIGPLQLLFFILIEIARMIVAMEPSLKNGVNTFFSNEWTLVATIYIPFVAYLAGSLRVVYGGTRLVTILKAAALSFWHLILILFVFRLGLFWSTYLTLKWFG